MKSKNTAETNETFDKRKYDLQWDKQNTKRIGMKLNKHRCTRGTNKIK